MAVFLVLIIISNVLLSAVYYVNKVMLNSNFYQLTYYLFNGKEFMSDKSKEDLSKYSDEELAEMVWQGKFGNGEERKKRLGARYNVVQKLVNKGIGKNNKQPSKQHEDKPDILLMVKKTIRGDYGSGHTRKKRLGKYYDEVQHQVILNLRDGRTRWDNIKLY